MAKNEFKPFATANGANVTSQSEYETLPALASGFQAGKASSAHINKAIRQASVIASVVAQFIANESGDDVLDDGDVTVLQQSLLDALRLNAADNLPKASTTASGMVKLSSETGSSDETMAATSKAVKTANDNANTRLLATGTAASATKLATARTIGGVSFDGTANINLPGVNAAGNQDTTGNAATVTKLATARTIGGVSFDGTANINLPGVNIAGSQSTTGNAATATKLATSRTINGVSFDGSANITIVPSTGSVTTAMLDTGGVTLPLLSVVPSVQGQFRNLKLSATGLSALIQVSADELLLGNGSGSYFTARSLSLPALSTASTGANGLDTGAITVSTWYSVWVIFNPTTATISGLLSLSETGPTLPSGYTHKARIGWVRTGSSNKYPLAFTQIGKVAHWKVVTGSNMAALPLMASGVNGSPTTPTWVAVATGNFLPPTAGAIRGFTYGPNVNTNTQQATICAPNNSYSGADSSSNPPPISSGYGATEAIARGARMFNFLLESTNIYFASNSSAAQLYSLGWEDNF